MACAHYDLQYHCCAVIAVTELQANLLEQLFNQIILLQAEVGMELELYSFRTDWPSTEY